VVNTNTRGARSRQLEQTGSARTGDGKGGHRRISHSTQRAARGGPLVSTYGPPLLVSMVLETGYIPHAQISSLIFCQLPTKGRVCLHSP
jgi:hypothetical protein